MIVGLHGKMRAGKNTAALRIAKLTPLPVIEVSYAAKLKQSVAALLGYTVEDIERWKNDPDVVLMAYAGQNAFASWTIREFLQRYGTEAHRDVFGEDFWLDAALPKFPRPQSLYKDSLYVVTDVRFQNEADRIRELDGIIVEVVGPETDTGSHASEQSIECDYTVNNRARDDDFAQLDRELVPLLQKIGALVPPGEALLQRNRTARPDEHRTRAERSATN